MKKLTKKTFKITLTYIDNNIEIVTYEALSRLEAYKNYINDSVNNNNIAKWRDLKSFSIDEV